MTAMINTSADQDSLEFIVGQLTDIARDLARGRADLYYLACGHN